MLKSPDLWLFWLLTLLAGVEKALLPTEAGFWAWANVPVER